MRTLTTGLMIAGAALFVAACGGGAANNTANAPVDNGAVVTNEPAMAPADMNAPMPADANAPAPAPAPADANAAAPGNATNGM